MSSGAVGSRRLFFALWPSDEFRDRTAAVAAPIARSAGGRAISPGNFHVTLLFLGEVPQSRLAVVQLAGASAAESPSFELRFDRVESWGRRVLSLTTSASPVAVTMLVDRLRYGLRDLPLRPDEHEFRPHITLARDLPRARSAESVNPLSMQAREFVLVESRRDADGSQYSVIERWPLLSSPLTPDQAVADSE